MRQGCKGVQRIKAWFQDGRAETDDDLGLDCQSCRESWGKEMLWRQQGDDNGPLLQNTSYRQASLF